MIWLELLVAYGRAVDALRRTAHVWVPPVVVAVAALGWGIYRTPRRPDTGPDTPAPCPDTPPDIPVSALPAAR